jgi:hypothetical protein
MSGTLQTQVATHIVTEMLVDKADVGSALAANATFILLGSALQRANCYLSATRLRARFYPRPI